MTLISFQNVSKSYQTGISKKSIKKALRNVSCEVRQAEVFGIVGANGAGKSTLIKILMGFVQQDAGEIILAGQPASSSMSRALLGYLPETSCLYPNLSISQHLQFSARIAGVPASLTQDRIEEILYAVDLFDAAKLPIKNMSKGMTQRAALAYALMLEPEILILDEPMSGLDPLGRKLVLDLIAEYHSKKKTILFCSHILSDVERISTRIGVMHMGELVSVTTPEGLADYKQKEQLAPEVPPLESFFLKTIQDYSNNEDNCGNLVP